MANILILDDSTDLLDVLQIIFKMNGHEATTAETTDFFFHELENVKPDLIFIDVNLRGIDGREICKDLKEKEKTKNIPIVLISAAPEKLKSYEDCKADGVIEKPFNKKELLTTVESLISVKQLLLAS